MLDQNYTAINHGIIIITFIIAKFVCLITKNKQMWRILSNEERKQNKKNKDEYSEVKERT